MTIHLVEHPLIDDVLAALRDETTAPPRFRLLTKQITTLVAVEATRNLPTRGKIVRTPLEETEVRHLAADVVLVPILRAGLGMLDVMLQLLPNATVGHVGLERDEETAVAREYYRKLPPLQERTVLILDPMLATGGSARAAIGLLNDNGANDVRLLSIVAAPEGVDLLVGHCPNVSIYTAAIDRGLNDQKFILPGLGDFGDRLYGTQFG